MIFGYIWITSFLASSLIIGLVVSITCIRIIDNKKQIIFKLMIITLIFQFVVTAFMLFIFFTWDVLDNIYAASPCIVSGVAIYFDIPQIRRKWKKDRVVMDFPHIDGHSA